MHKRDFSSQIMGESQQLFSIMWLNTINNCHQQSFFFMAMEVLLGTRLVLLYYPVQEDITKPWRQKMMSQTT